MTTYQRPTKGKPDMESLKIIYEKICLGKTNYKEVGKVLGVSDNAVRKWFKTEGWELPKKNLPQVKFVCDNCSKEFMREHNTLKNSRHGFHYCSTDCQYADAKRRWHKIHYGTY